MDDIVPQHSAVIKLFAVPKIPISQLEAVSAVLISCDISSLSWYGYDVMLTWLNLGTINT